MEATPFACTTVYSTHPRRTIKQEASNHSVVTKTAAAPPIKEAVETSGTVSKFLYNVHGDSVGFILDGGKQIHFPPHLSAKVLKCVKVGDKIHVNGKRLVAVDLTIAASITLPDGIEIVDNGPPAKSHKD
jgi:hypothetical protein